MTAQELKNSILQLAIQGKLVPQDPNDEPASVLLERIKKEKAELVKQGKIKKDKQESYIFKGDDGKYYEKIGAETKDITDEIPFEIPESWEWVRMKNLVSITTGNKDANFGSEDGQYDFFTCALVPIKSKTFSFSGESLILPGNGANVGVSIYYSGNFEAYQRTYVLQGFGIYLKYLHWVLTAQWRDYNKDKMFGSAIPYIKLGNLENFPVPLPPLSEQKRIVDKIEELVPFIEKYGKAETELTKLNKDFPEQIKKSILQYAIQGKLVPQNPNDEPASVLLDKIKAEKSELIKQGKIKKDKQESYIFKGDDGKYYEKIGAETKDITDEIPFEIPNSWIWCRLGNLGDWKAGSTPNRSNSAYYNGKIPWLKTGDLNDGIITDVPEYITDLAVKETSVRINPIGSVLIAMYGATIGKLGILGIESTTNQACCACIPFEGLLNLYLFYFLKSQKENFIARGFGGAQPNISREKIIYTLIPLPPLSEQQRIVAKIEELMVSIDKL